MYNTTIYQNETPFEMDLCNLLQTMKLEALPETDPSKYVNSALPALTGLNVQDDPMDETNYHSDGGSDYSSSSSNSSASNNTSNNNDKLGLSAEAAINPYPVDQGDVYGCAYLQAIFRQLESYPTTGGEYLEAIFTHREILNSYPGAHRDCARAFTDLAYMLEQRAWRADRDADMDAVTAFRHEAWMIATTLALPLPSSDIQDTTDRTSARAASTGCMIPPMY